MENQPGFDNKATTPPCLLSSLWPSRSGWSQLSAAQGKGGKVLSSFLRCRGLGVGSSALPAWPLTWNKIHILWQVKKNLNRKHFLCPSVSLPTVCIVYLHYALTRPPQWVDFPGAASGEESTCQCRRCKGCRLHPWVRKTPWSRRRQSTPLSLPGKLHGQRSLAGYSTWGHKDRGMTERLNTAHSRHHRRKYLLSHKGQHSFSTNKTAS